VREGEPRRLLAFVNYWLVRDEVHVLNVATHPSARRQGHAARPIHQVGQAVQSRLIITGERQARFCTR